jgi:hypothetical protein
VRCLGVRIFSAFWKVFAQCFFDFARYVLRSSFFRWNCRLSSELWEKLFRTSFSISARCSSELSQISQLEMTLVLGLPVNYRMLLNYGDIR